MRLKKELEFFFYTFLGQLYKDFIIFLSLKFIWFLDNFMVIFCTASNISAKIFLDKF